MSEPVSSTLEQAVPLPGRQSAMRRWGRSVGIFFAPIALLVVIAIQSPGVMSASGIKSLLVLASILGIASIGQTWTIITGGIDLSIPAVIGFATVTVAVTGLTSAPFALVLMAVAVGCIVIGVINGLLSSILPIHPLVITLGIGAIVTGAVLSVTGGSTGGSVPEFVTNSVAPITRTWFIPLPPVVVLWILLSVVVILTERKTPFGRMMFALGANPTAARFALVPAAAIRVGVFVVSAVCAGIAGILLAGFSGAPAADIGQPYMFETITAVVVGGTSLIGGRGSYARTIAGVLLTTELAVLMVGFGISGTLQNAFLGVAILALLGLYGRERRIAARI